MKLFLKGSRCATEKCAFNDRKAPPGPPSKRRPKLSGYATQLREKQKVKRIYGVLERQFRNYFEKATRLKGITGENLLMLLERRLDNALYRMGIAASRAQARNFISHGHILVNGHRVDIASYQVAPGDQLAIDEKLQAKSVVASNVELAKNMDLVADWLELNEDGKGGKVVRLPSRENVDIDVKEQVIVELYSK